MEEIIFGLAESHHSTASTLNTKIYLHFIWKRLFIYIVMRLLGIFRTAPVVYCSNQIRCDVMQPINVKCCQNLGLCLWISRITPGAATNIWEGKNSSISNFMRFIRQQSNINIIEFSISKQDNPCGWSISSCRSLFVCIIFIYVAFTVHKVCIRLYTK